MYLFLKNPLTYKWLSTYKDQDFQRQLMILGSIVECSA